MEEESVKRWLWRLCYFTFNRLRPSHRLFSLLYSYNES